MRDRIAELKSEIEALEADLESYTHGQRADYGLDVNGKPVDITEMWIEQLKDTIGVKQRYLAELEQRLAQRPAPGAQGTGPAPLLP